MIALSSAMFVYAYLRASCYSAVDRVPGFFLAGWVFRNVKLV